MNDRLIAPPGIARLVADWPAVNPLDADRMPKAGALVAIDKPRPLPGQAAYATSQLDGMGFKRKVEDLDLEHNPALSAADFPALFDYYFRGRARLPNLVAVDTLDGLRTITSWGGAMARPGLVSVALPGKLYTSWARVFLGLTQGQQLDGRGYLIANQREGDCEGRGPVWRFDLCLHAVEVGAGANHSRGWHPARCTRCGLDLSVDSGD